MNVALAGITLVASFARFKAPMAMFSEVVTSSRSFCRWDLSVMVDATRKRCDVRAVRKNPRLIEMSVRFVIACLVQSDPFDEVNYLRSRSWHPMNTHHLVDPPYDFDAGYSRIFRTILTSIMLGTLQSQDRRYCLLYT